MEPSSLTPAQIARRTVRGAAYLGFAQYATFGIGIIKGAILARLIAPESFGVVFFATTYVSFLSVFKMELRDVVTSSPSGEQARLVTQYGLELASSGAGIALAGALYAVAPGVCSPDCWLAIWVLLGMQVFAALTSTPGYILQRDIRQEVITRLTLIGAVLSLAASVALAYLGYPLPSLLANAAIPVVVSGIGAWLVVGWRPSRAWDRASVRDILSFGFTLWTTGLLGKIVFQFDDWLVGRLRGDRALGFYGKAYDLAKMPMDVVGGVIGQLATALYAQSGASGADVLGRAYRLTTWLLVRLVAFSSVVMLAAADELILLYYGREWLPLVPLLRLMFLFVLGRPLFQNNGQLLVALRHEKAFRRTVGLQAAILLVIGPPAVWRWGAEGASVAVSLMMVGGLLATQWAASRQVRVPLMPLYLLPAILCVILTPLLYGLGLVVGGGAILTLLVKVGAATALFGGITYLLERRHIREVLDLVKDNLFKRDEVPDAAST